MKRAAALSHVLYPGLPNAQLVFHKTSGEKDVYNGKYSCPVGPEFPIFDTKKKDWQFWMSKKESNLLESLCS